MDYRILQSVALGIELQRFYDRFDRAALETRMILVGLYPIIDRVIADVAGRYDRRAEVFPVETIEYLAACNGASLDKELVEAVVGEQNASRDCIRHLCLDDPPIKLEALRIYIVKSVFSEQNCLRSVAADICASIAPDLQLHIIAVEHALNVQRDVFFSAVVDDIAFCIPLAEELLRLYRQNAVSVDDVVVISRERFGVAHNIFANRLAGFIFGNDLPLTADDALIIPVSESFGYHSDRALAVHVIAVCHLSVFRTNSKLCFLYLPLAAQLIALKGIVVARDRLDDRSILTCTLRGVVRDNCLGAVAFDQPPDLRNDLLHCAVICEYALIAPFDSQLTRNDFK